MSHTIPSTSKELLAHHQKLLQASAISAEVIQARGYHSETVKSELTTLGFSPVQRVVPALVIPIWPLSGPPSLHQIRPDQPRLSRGKVVKYETPLGSSLQIDVPPTIREKVLSPDEPLFITEGIRKADSAASQGLACVALLGVYGWKQRDEFWRQIPLRGRTIYIAFDSDLATNRQVRRAAAGLFAFLESMGAKVFVIALPEINSQKTGLDDYFAAGQSVESLIGLATDKAPSFHAADSEAKSPMYEADDTGIVRIIDTENGPVRRQVSNFSARIVSETLFASGNEFQRELDLEATVRGQRQLITVSAEDFDRMSWPIPRLGADAIIFPGHGTKDEVRTAIQILSPNIRKLQGIDRLGWHLVHGEYVFAHAGGCIRAATPTGDNSDQPDRPAENTNRHNHLSTTETMGTIFPGEESDLGIRMRIPTSLRRYSLPKPSEGKQLVRDIKASLQLLALAPSVISVPIYGAIWYAGVAEPDFSVHLYGSTGSGKTEVAALATQHFGAGLDSRHLPANWSSTPNYIRAMAAHAGNVILPIDDFVPTGSQHDIDRSYRAAEDVFRAQGNAAGRGRCYRDGTPQEPEPPKCLTLSTGEVRPSGHSLTSRVIMLEVHPGDIMDRDDEVKKRAITKAQQIAKSGAYARVMAAYLQWNAADLERHRKSIREQTLQFREVFAAEARHARTVDAAAKLLAGLDHFLDFALTHGGIDEDLHEALWQIAHEALFEVLAKQEQDQADEDPVERFLDLLRTAFSTGRAHLFYMHSPHEDEGLFGSATFFGYQEKYIVVPKVGAPKTENASSIGHDGEASTAEQEKHEEKSIFTPMGVRVGWKEFDNLYIEPKEALAVVQRLAKDMAQPPLPMNHKALGKRLAERGLLVSSKKGRNVARVNILGRKEDVFHLRLDDFMELHRYEEDTTDEQNEAEYAEHEKALERAEQARALREQRRHRVHEFRQQQFMDLLNLSRVE
ncbi:DUF3854 domain-containing protein [Planctopirus hydrillae]|uniref:DUF3854 domain-containing protein n=1 Tax=Planctopirus hydrillae TaxID=1841610 RepID=A0A1C3E789_9PLAN|nr:DUF3854 domain-containing protein [Planctopirus hydrillae]ODA29093.1 hypothetical protein A6X21_09770 [Planctopirus hydrillae]